LDEIISNVDHRKAIANAAKRVLKVNSDMDSADLQKSAGALAKRKREDNDDAPAGKPKRGTASKPQQDFEKIIADAEMDIEVQFFNLPKLITEIE
jgi:hypothetical protein